MIRLIEIRNCGRQCRFRCDKKNIPMFTIFPYETRIIHVL